MRDPFQKLMRSKEREYSKVGVEGKNWSKLPKLPHNRSDLALSETKEVLPGGRSNSKFGSEI
jgi:hypothetical protein